MIMAQIVELSREEELERQKQLQVEQEAKLASLRAISAENLARQKIYAERAKHAETMVHLATTEALRDEELASILESRALERTNVLNEEARRSAETGKLARLAND